ncbi:hypothetical protein WJX81_003330 [Elliptochloris bilobata]|uniref:DUF1997 domain-containing protein n=1 Tax=Elliptochloris bilobata TaxID=381761 RepID=A0AAW1SJ23_9CHLO
MNTRGLKGWAARSRTISGRFVGSGTVQVERGPLPSVLVTGGKGVSYFAIILRNILESPYEVESSGFQRISTENAEHFLPLDTDLSAKRRAPVATLRASKSSTLDVEEGTRPLAEYMALPASQYSVLDAQRIERLDDSTFRCYVGGLQLFSLVVEPVLTVSVVVSERGPTVKLLATELQGSPAVEAANDRFSATMTNVVRWSDTAPAAGAQRKQLRSDTEIQVALEVPGWMRMVPVGAIERTGSGVMQRVLDSMVPRFLRQLAADYALWAAGDESRKPISTGQL